MLKISGSYFYGKKISDFGLQYNRVDYATFAKAFNHVLNNAIIENTANVGYWEGFNDCFETDDGDIEYYEIFQYYIVDNTDEVVNLLDEAGETYFINEELDVIVWGVTHWGTSWDYVLTDIPCNCGNDF